MPDFGSPIAQNVNVNPQQGLQTLSSVLGIQQQQQQLQAQRAQVYQAQQSAYERQQLAQINWKPFFDNDDIEGAQKTAMAVAPTTGAEFGQRLAESMNQGIAVKSNAAKLNQQYLEPFRNALGLWAADDKADISDLATQMDGVMQGVPKSAQKPVSDMVSATLKALSAPNVLTGAPKSPQEQKAGALALSRTGLAPSEVSGTGGLATPAAGGLVQQGPALVPTTVNRMTGVQSQAAAPPVVGNIGLTPTQQPAYQARVATATGAAAGQVGTDNQVFGKVMTAGSDAQRGIELAQRIQQEAAGVRTGQYTQDFANRLTILQQHDPGVTARQLLQKDAQNLKNLAESTAQSDKERDQIGGGFPSPDTMDPDAIQKSSRYWEGAFRMAAARSANAMTHVTQSGSTAGLTLKDQAFMSNASPGKFAPPEPTKAMPTGAKLTTYATTHFGGDTAKAQAYLKSQGYQ